METIHGIALRDGQLFVWVTSNGFTDKTHFELKTEIGIAGNMLTIIRTTPDHGRMKPHAARLNFSTPQVFGAEGFMLKNPINQQVWLGSSQETIPRETETNNEPKEN